MKTRELSLATFVLAAFGASIAACGAHGTTGVPEQSGVDTAAGRSGSGSAGAPVTTPGAGASGALSNAAGAPPAYAGATGVAGAGVSFGGAPAAGGAATGGAPATTGCVAAVGTIADLLIDDLDDGDGAIKAIGSRKGYWYTFNDGTAAQVPTSSATVPFMPAAGGYPTTSMFAATTSGPAFATWGAGVGFHFNEAGSNLCAYNATAYSGIKFWAKTSAPLKAMVQIPATTAQTSLTATDAPACLGTMCNDHFYLAVPITAAWTEYTIDFAATTFKQEGWGTPAAFDKSKLIGVQFQVGKGVAFNFSIDGITFY